MPKSEKYGGYDIRATSTPADVRIIVSGEVKGVVRQGFN